MQTEAILDIKQFPEGFFMQRHEPEVMLDNHAHSHVEILLPVGCDLTYLTQMGPVIAKDGYISVLWGQIPHRLSQIDRSGEVFIANLPLPELLSWSMPDRFLSALFTGQVISSTRSEDADSLHFRRWHDDYYSRDSELVQIARQELQLRLRRQSFAGWHLGHSAALERGEARLRPSQHVHKMIRFLAENYTNPISVSDVAAAATISTGYAMGAFKTSLGQSINGYLNQLRLHHAKVALIDSTEKVITVALDSGFGSLSRFYEVFIADTGKTPQQFRREHQRQLRD